MSGQNATWVKTELLDMGIPYTVLAGRAVEGDADIVDLEASSPQFGGDLRALIETFGPEIRITLFEDRGVR
jgi:hypothetical protein